LAGSPRPGRHWRLSRVRATGRRTNRTVSPRIRTRRADPASRSSSILSVGHRGAWYTVGPLEVRHVGLAGSGISWTEQTSPTAPLHAGHRWAFILLVFVTRSLG